MKVSVKGDLLTKTLARAALSKGSTPNPIHQLVKLEAKKGLKNELDQLIFSSTSGVLGMTTSIAAKVDVPGVVAANARDLLAASGAMPSGGIELAVTGTRVRLTGSSRRTWSGPTADALSIQPTPEPVNIPWVRVPVDALRTALERVSFPTGSITEAERAWDGVRLEVMPALLRAVGASRYQFAVLEQAAPIEMKASTKSWQALVPTMALSHLRGILLEADEVEQKYLDFYEDQAFLYIVGPSTLFIAAMPVGEYPPWELLLSNFPSESFCTLPRLALIESVRACLSSSGKSLDAGGVFNLASAEVTLSKKGTDTDFFDRLPTPMMRPDLNATFKVGLSYFLDCLKAAEEDPEFVLGEDGRMLLIRTTGGFRAAITLMDTTKAPEPAAP